MSGALKSLKSLSSRRSLSSFLSQSTTSQHAAACPSSRRYASTDGIKNKQPTKKSSNGSGLTSQYALVDHTYDAVVVGAG